MAKRFSLAAAAAFAAALAFVAPAPAPALAQEHPAPSAPAEAAKPTVYGDWGLRCASVAKALPCDLVQEIVQKSTNDRLVTISLGYRTDKDAHVIAIAVPLGIDLRRGVDISIGKAVAKGVRPTRCELSGCLILAALAPDMLQAMRSNDKGTLTVSGDGKTDTTIGFSLNGFVAGDDALKKRPPPTSRHRSGTYTPRRDTRAPRRDTCTCPSPRAHEVAAGL